MKTRYTVALAMLVGVGVGGAAIQGLHAQAKPPAIVVIDISDITDPEGFKAVTQRPTASTATVMQGGRYIARTSNVTARWNYAEAIHHHCLRQRGESTSLEQFTGTEED